MKRKIVESYSMEEAFRALNKKPSKKVVEAVDTAKSALPKVPAPYDKYFDVVDPAEIEFDDGMFQIGEVVDDTTILAYLAPKAEYEGIFDSWYFLIDDPQYPVVEIGGMNRMYPVDVEDLFGESLNKKSSKKVVETLDTDIIALEPAAVGVWDGFFADEMTEYMEDPDFGDSSVAQYYSEKGATESDLSIKKIFIVDPATLNPDDWYGPNDATPADLFKGGYIEDFGFQIANGDYLYTRANHDIGPAYVKCKSYESMCNYVRHGYQPNSWDADDLVEAVVE